LLQASTIQLLRFHFSFFLLPVYLFALSQIEDIQAGKALLVFFILHLLIYPASNGYNSYMDRDAGPIGGLRKPMQPTRQLFQATLVMDIAAVVLSVIVHPMLALCILFYILASRAYSYRGIRLKRYPITGFFTVFVFQGAVIYYSTWFGAGGFTAVPWLGMLAASLLIGASYPLTQIYQHREDAADGVVTISSMLGKRGSFLFSGIQFGMATVILYLLFRNTGRLWQWQLFLLYMFPVVLFFCYWWYQVWHDESKADFRNSLRMNLMATACMTLYFSTLILINHFE
jgi:1,4-dihydroxy-2-naphthoate polyprenyltransferase